VDVNIDLANEFSSKARRNMARITDIVRETADKVWESEANGPEHEQALRVLAFTQLVDAWSLLLWNDHTRDCDPSLRIDKTDGSTVWTQTGYEDIQLVFNDSRLDKLCLCVDPTEITHVRVHLDPHVGETCEDAGCETGDSCFEGIETDIPVNDIKSIQIVD
jgi:hypothetical protein